jgi:RES domain-containing protein
MRVWRIARERYDPLSGDGARLYGGRWSSPGRPVIYTAGHPALSVLEALVWTDPEDVPDDLRLYEIEIEGRPRPAVLRVEDLPEDWTAVGSSACLAAGDRWLSEGSRLAMWVPSAILPEGRNLLINPLHPGARALRVVESRPFRFDVRLLN